MPDSSEVGQPSYDDNARFLLTACRRSCRHVTSGSAVNALERRQGCVRLVRLPMKKTLTRQAELCDAALSRIATLTRQLRLLEFIRALSLHDASAGASPRRIKVETMRSSGRPVMLIEFRRLRRQADNSD